MKKYFISFAIMYRDHPPLFSNTIETLSEPISESVHILGLELKLADRFKNTHKISIISFQEIKEGEQD